MGAKIGVLLNCGQQSQFSKVRREFDAGRVNLDPPMTCADWPVPGNLTLLHTQTAYTGKPLHRCAPLEGGYARRGRGKSIPSDFIAFDEGEHIIDCTLEDGTRTKHLLLHANELCSHHTGGYYDDGYIMAAMTMQVVYTHYGWVRFEQAIAQFVADALEEL